MCNYAGTCKGICNYNLVCNFLIWLLPLQSSAFVVHFLNALWHGKEAFPKGSYYSITVFKPVRSFLCCLTACSSLSCFFTCLFDIIFSLHFLLQTSFYTFFFINDIIFSRASFTTTVMTLFF